MRITLHADVTDKKECKDVRDGLGIKVIASETSFDPVCPSVCWTVGWSVCHNVLKWRGKFPTDFLLPMIFAWTNVCII